MCTGLYSVLTPKELIKIRLSFDYFVYSASFSFFFFLIYILGQCYHMWDLWSPEGNIFNFSKTVVVFSFNA